MRAQTLGLFDGQADVGSVQPAGTAHYDASAAAYTLTAAGANLWSTTDAFHYVWKKASGDLSLTAEVTFTDVKGSANPHRKAVLIFRQSLDPSSSYVDAAQHGSGMTAMQYRRENGAITQDIEVDIAAPETVRIEKRGDTFTMFLAGREGHLHQVGASIKLPLKEPFYVGLGLCSHNPGATEKAVFSHVELKPVQASQNSAPAPYSTLQTVDMDGRASVVYTTRGRFEAPNWTKDGNNLIFDQDGKMMIVPAAGGTPKTIEVGAATKCNGSHGLSPDGHLLAITCSMPNKPEARVYVVPMSGGEPRLVTEHPDSYWHSWSPDGKTIIFTRPDHGSGNIFAIPLAGGEEKALTTGTGISDDPDYSPDGQFIYFNSDRGGTEQIWRMRPDGSQPQQMTNDDRVNWTPHNSPDGKSIVFISYEHGTTGHPVNRDISLRVLSPEDGRVRTIVDLVGGSGTMNVPSWAPDSSHLAFVSYQMLPAEDAGSSE